MIQIYLRQQLRNFVKFWHYEQSIASGMLEKNVTRQFHLIKILNQTFKINRSIPTSFVLMLQDFEMVQWQLRCNWKLISMGVGGHTLHT